MPSRPTGLEPAALTNGGDAAVKLKLARLRSGEPEIFASVQGEGVSAGRPSTFIRLSLCNLTCTWCDTKYTWDWARYDPGAEIAQVGALEIVERVTAIGIENVVVTGGEPLMQQDALAEVTRPLARARYRIEVETNGTFLPSADLRRDVSQWNVSPKLSNSGNPDNRRQVRRALRWFARAEHAWFKLVIDTPADIDEADTFVERHGVSRSRVILMPQGASAIALKKRSTWLAEACARRGYRFSTRVHILLWGGERGR